MIDPYYQDEYATIYHGDCRDILEDVTPSQIDAVVSDPPYGMGYSPVGSSSTTQSVAGDGVRQGVRILRGMFSAGEPWFYDETHFLVFCHWSSMPDFIDAVGMRSKIRNVLIWNKGGGLMGDTRKNYGRGDYEMIIYGGRGKRELLEMEKYGSVITCPRVSKRVHPTEKPTEVLATLVRHHVPADGIVLDPFMGSGSTLVAAKYEGRRSIGIELDESHCEVAAQRLVAATTQSTLFGAFV